MEDRQRTLQPGRLAMLGHAGASTDSFATNERTWKHLAVRHRMHEHESVAVGFRDIKRIKRLFNNATPSLLPCQPRHRWRPTSSSSSPTSATVISTLNPAFGGNELAPPTPGRSVLKYLENLCPPGSPSLKTSTSMSFAGSPPSQIMIRSVPTSDASCFPKMPAASISS